MLIIRGYNIYSKEQKIIILEEFKNEEYGS
jgi:hypothetical protein